MNIENTYIKDPSIREDMLKVKMYRIFSYIFFVVGFLVFLMLYNSYMSGRTMLEIFSFAMVAIVLIPFLPAVALSWVAIRTDKSTEKALDAYFEEERRKKEEQLRKEEARIKEIEAAREAAEAGELDDTATGSGYEHSSVTAENDDKNSPEAAA